MTALHMTQFDNDMIQLAAVVCGMVGYVEEQVINITEGMMEQNPLKIDSVKNHQKNVRKLALEATQRTIEIFVKHKPKGDQAKLLLVSWRNAISLERITNLLVDAGRQSSNLALYNLKGAKTAFMNIQQSLMAQTYDLVISYTADKPELIPKILAQESHIRNIYKGLFQDMIKLGTKEADLLTNIEACISIAKIFEQVAFYIHEIADNLNYKYNNFIK